MNINELGEFGLIRELTQMIQAVSSNPIKMITPREFSLLIDIGDDASGWRSSDSIQLATTDTLVEGTHFSRDTTSWHDLGWKLMAANVSDIAAMGGHPAYVLVTLGLPEKTDMDRPKELYEGILEFQRIYGGQIIGGDIVRSPTVFVSATLLGICYGAPLRRSNAQPGEYIAVTGYLGASAGGLQYLLSHDCAKDLSVTQLIDAHRRPHPCPAQGQILIEAGIRAAMDISDGLVSDLEKMCTSSGTAAQIHQESIPIHPAVKTLFGENSLTLALTGGEDYQLVFTGPQHTIEHIMPDLPEGASIIGQMINVKPGQLNILDSRGQELPDVYHGWDHFR